MIEGQPLHQLLERLRATATTGLHYASDDYNRSRYAEILEDVMGLYAQLDYFKMSQLPPLDALGYITPKVGVNAIVQNEAGEILLEKRVDDHCWCIIGGWCEPGLSPEENLLKEVREETGLEVELVRLVGIFSRRPSKRFMFSSYHLLYECSPIGGSLRKSFESEEVAFLHPKEVKNWHHDHREWVEYFLRS